jgi:MurNAc alpha-1-phosphate uridylyltransferase
MVPNPAFHVEGDFVLRDGRVHDGNGSRLTFGSIGVFDTALFRGLPRGVHLRLRPLFEQWIAAGIVSGERWDGPWANVGTPADLALLDTALAAQPKDS